MEGIYDERDEEKREEKISLIEKLLSKKEIIVGIGGGLIALYPICNTICNLFYQFRCEKFYNLPGKYFHFDIGSNLLYLGCIILLLIACIMPVIYKKYNEREGNLTKGVIVYGLVLVFIIGMALGLINVFNLIEIMKQAYKINAFLEFISYILIEKADITITIIVVLGILTLFLITFIDKISYIKWKWLKKIVSIVFTVSFTSTFLLMLYGTMFKLNINTAIEDKTKYEFLTIEDKEYVVLSEYEDSVLVVPYEVNRSGQYIFKTDQYFFCDQYAGKYKYVDLKYTPLVNKED